MIINQILEQYDAMFGRFPLEEIETYLRENIEEARQAAELENLVTLLNEMIGFCRDTTQREKALSYCGELQSVLKALQLENSVPYGTSLLNIANAYRAFGLCGEALEFYGEVLKIYEANIPVNDFSYASLYNNWALVYQEIDDHQAAVGLLEKALEIVIGYKEALIPQATTRTNLATSLLLAGTKEAYEEAMEHLQKALEIFKADGERDFHYGAALVAMGDAYDHQKDYQRAADYYKAGLAELEKHTGKTANYERVLEKYEHALGKCTEKNLWRSNLERCKEFYENTIKPMIDSEFPAYKNRIAVGLVGEGSDCFGFDDEISTDHDYEIGLCFWLTKEDYQEIGKELQEAYLKRVDTHGRLQDRRGVFSLNDFYNQLLETDSDFEGEYLEKSTVTEQQKLLENVEEYRLAAAVNGEVFSDSLGIFSEVRNRLKKGYPEELWKKKFASKIHEFSQYAQSNYARMMAREDSVSALICVGKAIECVMDLMYLLEGSYAPYYKWKKKGLENSKLAKDIFPILEKIAALPNQSAVWEGYRYQAASIHTADAKVSYFEEIAAKLLAEMKARNLVDGTDLFLESYIKQILDGKNMDLIEKIILEEWSQFDLVKNEGGRADCQDDFATFSLMRKSQYLTWDRELLESFYEDLCAAKKKGWNLIMEKYARMMKSTNPEKYAQLEPQLPVLSEERIQIQEEIIKIQIGWMETFAENYPKLSANARSIHTEEDSAYNTSYETYLRGEMGTYSEKTFVLYVNFIIACLRNGKNLSYDTMEHTVKLYGYGSLEDAEKKMKEW